MIVTTSEVADFEQFLNPRRGEEEAAWVHGLRRLRRS
jgi:hypothetical protein